MSRFITEIPENVKQIIVPASYRHERTGHYHQLGKGSRAPDGWYKSKEDVVADFDENQDIDSEMMFQVGDYALHPKYGRGEVTAISAYRQSHKITMQFRGGTTRSFILEYTELEKTV